MDNGLRLGGCDVVVFVRTYYRVGLLPNVADYTLFTISKKRHIP